ncbi:YozQ family protein [Domibacillus sp. 8LH]|uniref:YozQ family protein n=1 Tax=Domibacillus sp. 8LH TaxID=3073900 RepID=UPI00316EED95
MTKEKQQVTPVRNFNMNDYHKNDETAKGLATTHEQVSDLYKEGEVAPSKYEETLPRNSSNKTK